MSRRRVAGMVVRHGELAVAVAFVAMVLWELIEYLALEGPRVRTGPLPLVLHSIQVVLVLAVTWAVLRAWQARTRHQDALARMLEKVVMAQEEERRRIGYELHDGVAQLIVSAKQHVDTCRGAAMSEPDRLERELMRASERLHGAIVETRRVLRALRSSAVDSVGLAEAMRRALDEAAHEAGWTARFAETLGDARLPAAVETAAFRILQEGLVNAARHAPSRNVAVEVGRREQWLCLEIRDDGIGFEPADSSGSGRGLGLAGMRERARLLGGTCRIESRRGDGTCIAVALPLVPARAND